VAVIGADGRPRILDGDGERIVPSVIALSGEGRLLVGRTARNQYAVDPANAVRSVKRSMGTNEQFQLGGSAYSAPEISALILTKMKEIAQANLGASVTRAVITVPAHFSDAERQATKTAGEIAGLEVVRIINEPTAAALAYTVGTQVTEKLLVYDLGGGTFDVSIVQIEAGVVEVLATAGNNRLGGDDFDRRIVDHVAEYFAREHEIDLRIEPRAFARLLLAAEQAKIQLSDRPFTTVREEFVAESDDRPLHLDFELTRERFEHLIEDLLDLTVDLLDRALADAELTAPDLDRVLLVGGSTRIPAVRRRLEEHLGIEPLGTIHPDECVALGAAVQAGIIDGDELETILVDVSAHSLGIAAMQVIGWEPVPDRFSVVIPRNTVVPASKAELYTTTFHGQESVMIRVYQGEESVASENVFLGEFELRGLPRSAPAGEPKIAVTFDYDVNGIVHVRAEERKSRRRGGIEIRDARERMDAATQERAARQVAELWSQRDENDEIPSSTRRLLRRARETASRASAESREALLAITAQIETLFGQGPLDLEAEDRLGRLEDELLDRLQSHRD
jgi:molecular chaperone DnaK